MGAADAVLTWHDVAVLLEQSLPGSSVARHAGGDAASWTPDTVLLWRLVHQTEVGLWARGILSRKPTPPPTPFDEPDAAESVTGDAMLVEDMARVLGWDKRR